MKSDSRAMAAFALVGVVLVVIAWFVSHTFEPEGGAATLPEVTYPHAVAPAGSSPPGKPEPGSSPRLMRQPSLSKTQIAFAFAGEIWTVSREGGEAQRIVTGQLRNFRPIFSPDGSQIAFTGVYDGNWDVYVVPAAGGETHRLTYHPGYDAAVGWTPDGTRVLFQSLRDTPRDLPKLFTVPLAGGA